MSPQQDNLDRVRERIRQAVLSFCRHHKRFYAEELRRWVIQFTGIAAPGSADRILRDMRQRGELDYICLSRSESLYEVLWVPPLAPSSGTDPVGPEDRPPAGEGGVVSKTPEQITASAETMRRKTTARMIAVLCDLAAGPQPVSIQKLAKVFRVSAYGGAVSGKLALCAILPWFQVRTLPGPKYELHVDLDVKAQCDTLAPGVTGESPKTFHKRLLAEVRRRRKEVGDRKINGSWTPDAVSKLGLTRVLDYVEAELENFNSGHPVNARGTADTVPQCGDGEDLDGNQNQIGISALNQGAG
jgi:hypothetical protein